MGTTWNLLGSNYLSYPPDRDRRIQYLMRFDLYLLSYHNDHVRERARIPGTKLDKVTEIVNRELANLREEEADD
jgi:hypothetical protein